MPKREAQDTDDRFARIEDQLATLTKAVTESPAQLQCLASAEIRDTKFEIIERLSRIENSIEIIAREFAGNRG